MLCAFNLIPEETTTLVETKTIAANSLWASRSVREIIDMK